VNQFQDVYLPAPIQGIPATTTPKRSTRITMAKSGAETRNQNWKSSLRKFTLPKGIVNWENLDAVIDHFEIMDGPTCTWPWNDPVDNASVPAVPPDQEPMISALDQFVAAGDGVTMQFQLIKTRSLGGFSRVRPIYIPIVDTVVIALNGMAPGAVPSGFPYYGPYTFEGVTRPGGIITISPAPVAALNNITAGFLFDNEVRWEADDTLQAAIESMETASAAPLTFVEARRC
jgi:uncharacterized protein (TIGR02217 family)